MRPPSRLALAAALALAAGSLRAQPQSPAVPARPRLAAAGADTNDAHAYYLQASRLIAREPKAAADAFYWAARLQPDLAEAYYGRRVALLLARERRELLEYWTGNRKTREAPETLRIDSLSLRALELNPLHLRAQDDRLLRAVFEAYVYENARRQGVPLNQLEEASSELNFHIESQLNRAGPEVRAMFALSAGRADAALAAYREALKRAPKDERADLLASMGRAWAQAGNPDSAIASFEQALADLRARDRKSTVRWYESKAVLEHSVGILHERMGRDSAAREAYGRALQEDLAYYPAHVRLATLALARADTAQAVSELELAAQLRDQDAYVHYVLGVALAAARRADRAVEHLQRAAALEPWFAAPHQLLARLYDGSSMAEEAAAAYRAFLARAAQGDQSAPHARERLAKLAAASGGPAAP